jgi:hypothetical protein
LARLRASGLTITVRVASPATRLVVKVASRVPGSARAVIVGMLAKRVGAGTVTLRVPLTGRGKSQLGALTKTRLRITIVGRSAQARSVSLKGSLFVRP